MNFARPLWPDPFLLSARSIVRFLRQPLILAAAVLLLAGLAVPVTARAQPADAGPAQKVSITLKASAPEEVAEMVRRTLKKTVAQIVADSEHNAVVLTDAPAGIAAMRELVGRLDVQRTVPVKTSLVRVLLGDEHMEGIDWEAIVSDFVAIDVEGRATLEAGRLSADDLPMLMEALETVGDVDTAAYPALTVEDGETVDFALRINGEETVVTAVVPSRVQNGGQRREPAEGDLWMNFTVRTGVHLDRTITLDIRPHRRAAVPDAGAVLQIDEDEVVVIGGLFQDEEVSSTRKVPLLGDIPFFGSVFRSRTSDRLRTEVILLLIPGKIEGGDEGEDGAGPLNPLDR